MAKKRKTLTKDFKELLSKGNLEELKELFNKCDPSPSMLPAVEYKR